ncbi:hypothetical protein ACHAWF_012140, partial [Thalassiosira exigua]
SEASAAPGRGPGPGPGPRPGRGRRRPLAPPATSSTAPSSASAARSSTRLSAAPSPDAAAESLGEIRDAPADGAAAEAAAEVARRLRERARSLRREVAADERTLRDEVRRRKDDADDEADGWIEMLLGEDFEDSDGEAGEAGGEEEASPGGGATGASRSGTPSARTLALRIEASNLISERKLLSVVDRLHERETAAMTGPEGYLSRTDASDAGGGAGGGFVIGDYENNSLESKRAESDRISGLLDRILEAVQIIEEKRHSPTEPSESERSSSLASTLRIRAADLRRSRDALIDRRVDALAASSASSKASKGGKDDPLEGYVQSSMDGSEGDNEGDNDRNGRSKREREKKMLARLVETPPWLPPSLAAFAATSPVEVSSGDFKAIKTDLLADSELVCTSWDCTDVAAVYRLRVRRPRRTEEDAGSERERENNAESQVTAAFGDLQSRLEDHPLLRQEVRFFLIRDREWRPSGWDADDSSGPPPAIVALAREVEPEQESERGTGTKVLAAFSTLMTLATTLAYAVSGYALNPAFFSSVVQDNDPSAVVPACLPVFGGVLALAALHELGHAAAARLRGVRLGRPVPLPSLQCGTFGCITPFRSFPPDRRAIFDVAVAGAGVALVASLATIVAGLGLTVTAGAGTLASYPYVPAALLKSSFLVGTIASVVAPEAMLAELSRPMPVHPMFLVGFAGLLMSSVNLLPIGRLDGGRACMAAWGRRAASAASFLSLLALAICSLGGLSNIAVFWGALVVTTQKLPDVPAADEVAGVGDLRSYGFLGLLALSVSALLPFPGGAGPV